jgi:hypothetical protein
MNTLKELERLNIPFAVICARFSLSQTINKHTPDYYTPDWFVAAAKKHAKTLRKLRFTQKSYIRKVTEKTLTQEELNWFKEHRDRFVRVLSVPEGIVYELKNQSLKQDTQIK